MTPALIRTVPNLSAPGTAAAMIAVATSQVGYREGRANDNIFGAWYGANYVAWCAQYLSWAAAHSGCAEIIPKHGYTPTGAEWYRDHHRWGDTPAVGAIGFLYSPTMGRIHHEFLVTAILPGGYVATVEGNTTLGGSATGDGVYRLRRHGVGGALGGYGYPDYTPAPPTRTVSLAAVLAAAHTDPAAAQGHISHRAAVLLVERALVAEGLLGAAWVDGSFGSKTIIAYATWQRSPAGGSYTGPAADGYPGKASLTRLGARHNFTVTTP